LLWESGNWGRGEFGNQEEGECRPLEAASTQRLMKTSTHWEDVVSHIVICEGISVVMSCKSSINPITDPNPVYSH
jgi:hypothetical protein